MAMSNNDTYTLTVMWGKYNVLNDDQSATVQRFCWHAIATHIRYTDRVIVVPTGWTDTTPDNVETSTIECYAATWGGMSENLSALVTFWNE